MGQPMPDEGARTADAAQWPASEGALCPWIGRFLWSPAMDLHPSRRRLLLPGWPEEAWSDPALLAHLSRHLLRAHGLQCEARAARVEWDSADGRCLIALLPQTALARLARRVGLALHGPTRAAAEPLDDTDRAFIERAPLYWRAPVPGEAPESSGWQAVCALVGTLSERMTRRFEWKTPAGGGEPVALPGTAALLGLTRKILKELEEPWCSLFETLRRPERQIRLSA